MNKLKILDLFSGIGGFSLGLERTGGFETVAFCEIDKEAQKVLRKHWPSVPIFEDVKSLSAKDFNGPIDIICGGFPCQDISLAGKGAGLEGERSGLWFEFKRLIQELQPKWVIAENVSALRSRGLDQVLRSLSEIGYDAEWHCIPASAVGAPHRRDRIWIVAYPRHGSWRDTLGSGASIDSRRELEETVRISEAVEASGSGQTYQAMANPDNTGSRTSRHGFDGERQEIEQEREVEPFSGISRCGSTVANPDNQRPQGWSEALLSERSFAAGHPRASAWWEAEPELGRVADGIPRRTHRLKQLGNAVVPQIPELIGNAILQSNI